MSRSAPDPALLEGVEKPGRYAGGEWNIRRKDPRRVRTRVALVFPDVYELGMSYLGQKILYGLLNDMPSVAAERVFAPWPDFEEKLRRAGKPLFSLETKTPLRAFDIIGFSLLYELDDTNILTILETGSVPLTTALRDNSHPLVIAGGPAGFNPEPTAEVFDLFLFGDGEEAFPEIVDRYAALKSSGLNRPEILEAMAGIPGVYVPSLYDAVPSGKTALLVPHPRGRAPVRILKRILRNPGRESLPTRIVVPSMRAVFDRAAVEPARGCPQNCRFCQAAAIYFPHRAKSASRVIEAVLQCLRRTGYEDASLSALSVGDYPRLEDTVRVLMEELNKEKISLSLSSLRPGALSEDVVRSIVQVRKTGFTLVPEAGTERLRRVINKKLKDEDIRDALTYAFSHGWKLVKLYFMIGLPTETEEDLRGIVDLIRDILSLGRGLLQAPPRLNIGISSFIPKPHTPFQWLGMEEADILAEKWDFLRSELRKYRSVEVKSHPIAMSVLEGVFSRGDRRLGSVLQRAWRAGARFDGWRDHFDFSRWEAAFAAEGLDYREYLQPIDKETPLPWDIVETGIRKEHLLLELDKALREEESPSCRETSCSVCGGCSLMLREAMPEGEALQARPNWPSPLGERIPAPRRYRAFYRKGGPARFISHIDLIHVLQRSFRRAGIEVIKTQGFHPKMAMSYGPALPLGMEGYCEILEFKAARRFGEEDFLARVNKSVPEGIRFLGLTPLETASPPLSRIISSSLYSLDIRQVKVRRALAGAAETQGRPGESSLRTVKTLLTAYEARRPAGATLGLDAEKKRIRIEIAYSDRKGPRAQDIVRDLLGVEDAVFLLVRERVAVMEE